VEAGKVALKEPKTDMPGEARLKGGQMGKGLCFARTKEGEGGGGSRKKIGKRKQMVGGRRKPMGVEEGRDFLMKKGGGGTWGLGGALKLLTKDHGGFIDRTQVKRRGEKSTSSEGGRNKRGVRGKRQIGGERPKYRKTR